MLFDFMVEEFKKNFKPVFKEQGLDTICYLDDQAIVKKNEAEQAYVWIKEYPPEIKDFIIEELEKVLKPKFFLATYNRTTGEVKNYKGQKVNASIVKNNHLLNILIFLDIEEISGLLVRQNDGTYEFRPVIEEEDKGFSTKHKKNEVLRFLKHKLPHFIGKKE